MARVEELEFLSEFIYREVTSICRDEVRLYFCRETTFKLEFLIS